MHWLLLANGLKNFWFHESVIISLFWHSYFLHYGHFVEYMNCMKWTDAADGGRLDFAPMHVATQVMLGVSLQARCYTT